MVYPNGEWEGCKGVEVVSDWYFGGEKFLASTSRVFFRSLQPTSARSLTPLLPFVSSQPVLQKRKAKSVCYLFKASQVCKILLKMLHPVPGQTQLCPCERDLEAFRECDFDFTFLR